MLRAASRRSRRRPELARVLRPAATTAAVLVLAACGSGGSPKAARSTASDASVPTTPLPGSGKPPVTIGDKNFTEQFVLGELYKQALTAKGFDVTSNRNIGPTEVTISALQSGRVDMYPEYLGVWNTTVAGDAHPYRSARAAYAAGQSYALAHGLALLARTPFSDVDAIGVTLAYATANNLQTIADLARIEPTLTLGAPQQFQQRPSGLPGIARDYGVVPAAFKALDVGDQYQALDHGSVQAADVNTTDGQLQAGSYVLLSDPMHLFGWGNVVPVVTQKALQVEGPVFAQTINAVSALLSTDVMRQLNAAVDVSHQDPALVAKQFLIAHGLEPTTSG